MQEIQFQSRELQLEPTLHSKESLQQAKLWLEDSKNIIPSDVKICLLMLLENMLKGEKSSQTAAKGFHELLVKFGFKSSSEKLKKTASSKDTPSAEVVKQLARVAKRRVAIYKSAKAKLDKQMQQKLIQECKERNAKEIKKLEALEEIADEEEREKAEEEDFENRLALGKGEQKDLAPSTETIFSAEPIASTEQQLNFPLTNESLVGAFGEKPTGLKKETIVAKRYDFSLQLHEFKVSYESAKDSRTGKSVSSAPESIGPKGFQITYRALVNVVLLTVGFLVPMHRVSRLLGNASIFHRSNLARYLGYAANRMLPIYLEIAKQLSQASYLWADATPTRVNEVNRAFENRKEWDKEKNSETPEPFPWEKDFKVASENKKENKENEEEHENIDSPKLPLWAKLQSELGYAFFKKAKKKLSAKTRHQTMVVHGRTDEKNANSHLVFYRSCLGDVGNVLDYLLQFRDPKNKDLVLQCDHSSANLPTNPSILKRFNLTIAGCLAHARRMFKKHESQDPLVGSDILPMMFMVMNFESKIKEAGKNTENTTSVRQSWSARYLETIYFALQQAVQMPNWSDQTPLGKAARHFIKHFKKLTVYLAHPALEATNNGSERALRAEKLSQGSSYFRDTMEGRARFDILRTLYQTCACANIPFSHFMMYILISPQIEVEKHPAKFTPLAVKELLESSPELKIKLDTILTRGY
jgi:hypothetical protein